jgi:phospholipid/cholesterol/gamma-HCH transport system permease protein
MMWFIAMFGLPRRGDLALLIRQIYNIGVLSLVIIVLSAFSIGAVIALQFYTQLARFGAEDAVGLGLALVLLRELGPVVTALLFAGRAGSAITAEIGLMKSTEQLSSMEMMGVDPLHRIVAPRLWAGLLCMPLLAAIFNIVAIYGGSVVAVQWLGSDPGSFWAGMQDAVELWEDVGKGSIKSVVFAVVVTWIAVYQGYDTVPTAEGIGLATTRTVVMSSVMVLAIDFLLTLGMYGDFK